ncbi:TPA: hypothetical protein RNX31_002150 [Pasteurella multocida]|nr:hypothetical protein [Pasteurella multocida]
MKSLDLQSYAYALIYAFEHKQRMKAKAFTVREWKIISAYIQRYLNAKKSGIFGTVQVLNDYHIISQKAEIKVKL